MWCCEDSCAWQTLSRQVGSVSSCKRRVSCVRSGGVNGGKSGVIYICNKKAERCEIELRWMVRQSQWSIHTNAVWWMYGVEIWRCSSLLHRHIFHAWLLEPIEQVQLRALRMFFGVGTLHPIYIIILHIGKSRRSLASLRSVMLAAQ